MKKRRVVTTPEADEDAKAIDLWWAKNRSAAPNLFVEELADAIGLLGVEAGVGVRHAHRAIGGLHRYLLRSSRYHLYFVYNDDVVVIVAISGATRGTTPRFAKRAAGAASGLATPERPTTVPGYVNRNDQTVVRATGLPGTDHLQRIYELSCGKCAHSYGSNGSDNFQRKCPNCQGGAPGLPLE